MKNFLLYVIKALLFFLFNSVTQSLAQLPILDTFGKPTLPVVGVMRVLNDADLLQDDQNKIFYYLEKRYNEVRYETPYVIVKKEKIADIKKLIELGVDPKVVKKKYEDYFVNTDYLLKNEMIRIKRQVHFDTAQYIYPSRSISAILSTRIVETATGKVVYSRIHHGFNSTPIHMSETESGQEYKILLEISKYINKAFESSILVNTTSSDVFVFSPDLCTGCIQPSLRNYSTVRSFETNGFHAFTIDTVFRIQGRELLHAFYIGEAQKLFAAKTKFKLLEKEKKYSYLYNSNNWNILSLRRSPILLPLSKRPEAPSLIVGLPGDIEKHTFNNLLVQSVESEFSKYPDLFNLLDREMNEIIEFEKQFIKKDLSLNSEENEKQLAGQYLLTLTPSLNINVSYDYKLFNPSYKKKSVTYLENFSYAANQFSDTFNVRIPFQIVYANKILLEYKLIDIATSVVVMSGVVANEIKHENFYSESSVYTYDELLNMKFVTEGIVYKVLNKVRPFFLNNTVVLKTLKDSKREYFLLSKGETSGMRFGDKFEVFYDEELKVDNNTPLKRPINIGHCVVSEIYLETCKGRLEGMTVSSEQLHELFVQGRLYIKYKEQ